MAHHPPPEPGLSSAGPDLLRERSLSNGKTSICLPQYEADRLQATGGNFAKIFDVQNKKFVTVSCCQCGYTELYKEQGGEGWDVLDFLMG